MKEKSILFVLLVAAFLNFGVAVLPEIGFGQLTDSALEGESKLVRIRILPDPLSVNVSGTVVPLTYVEYQNYQFQRTLPDPLPLAVQDALNITGDRDPAESTDFNNETVAFTIPSGAQEFDIQMRDIIINDTVNEAEEILILVLELTDTGGMEINFDEELGILIYNILDDNSINLILRYNGSTSFNESYGAIQDVITVEKEIGSPPTEVDIPVDVIITGIDTAIEGEDFVTASYRRSYTILINETVAVIDPIDIVNDIVPETDEIFSISLEKGSEADFLNIFPTTTPIYITIEDDDVASVVFTEEVYTVTEGEDGYAEVCVALDGGVSFNSSSANATFNIATFSITATEGEDYDPTPEPVTLVLTRGQDRDCSNITITNDLLVEENELLSVSITSFNHTFSAGINFFRDTANISIEDDDAAIVGFNKTSYTGSEGDTLTVCVDILFPNATVLAMSDVQGTFNITGSDGSDATITGATDFVLNSTTRTQCFNLTLLSDSLIEGDEMLDLFLSEPLDSFGVRLIQPNTTNITIIDVDFAEIGFEKSAYILREDENAESSIDICVELVNGVIGPDVFVNYSLIYSETQSTSQVSEDSINTTVGYFSDSRSQSCHSFTVENNTVAERNGIVSLTIDAPFLFPANTMLDVQVATVTVVNDDVVKVRMSASSNSIDEGATSTITVTYNHDEVQIGGGVTVNGAISGSAVGDDYMVPGPFQLTLDQAEQDITITAVDDKLLEDAVETFTISLTLINPDILAIVDTNSIDISINDNEVAEISFEQSVYTFVEDISSGRQLFVGITNTTIQLPPDANMVDFFISVNATIHPSTNATRGVDYEIGSLTLKLDSDVRERSIDLDIFQDDLVEGHEIIYITLGPPVINGLDNENGAVLSPNGDSTLVIIEEDDEIVVGFTNMTDASGGEGTSIQVCIGIFDGQLAPNVTLAYLVGAPREESSSPLPAGLPETDTATVPSNSTSGDYKRTSTRIALSEATRSDCTTIELIDDTIVEEDEIFLVQVEQVVSSNDLRFPLDPEFVGITIIDDDEIMMGFESVMYAFNETSTATTVTITVQRENEVTVSTAFDLTIILLTSMSTAIEDDDFSVVGGFNVTLSFGGEDERQSFSLTILPDDIGEGPEIIALQIEIPTEVLDGVVPGMKEFSNITIIDDDFIEYQFTQQEYRLTEEQMRTEVCVVILPGNVTFTPDGYLTLMFLTSPITAEATDDYDEMAEPMVVTLTDMIRELCVNVSVVADDLVEGRESFLLFFETIGKLGSYSVNGSNSTVVTITDSNVAEVGFNSSVYSVMEGEEDMVSVCVGVLSGELADVVILNYTLSFADGSATADEDYLPVMTPYTGVLSQSNRLMCHFIVIEDDTLVEPPETIDIAFTPIAPPEFIHLFNNTRPEAQVEITDDDLVTVGFEESEYTVRENAGSVEVCLRFRGPLKNDSFVDLHITTTSSHPNDHATAPVPDTLQLDMNNTLKCVTINITNDNEVEGTEVFMVHFTETDDNRIMIDGTDTVPVYIEDDEAVILEFVQQSYTFREDSSTNNAVIGVTIGNYDELVIKNDIRFTVSRISGNATNPEDFVFFHGGNHILIPVGENSTTFMLIIADDEIVEGIESSVIIITDPDIDSIVPDNVMHTSAETTVFILDNDEVTIGFESTVYTYPEGTHPVCVTLMNGTLQDNVVIRYLLYNTSAADDYPPINQVGEITRSTPTYCHNVSITDDNLVESLEYLEMGIVDDFNVANVSFFPDMSTVTIDDDDSVLVGFERTAYANNETGGDMVQVNIVREDSLISVHDFTVRVLLSPHSTATDVDFTIVSDISQIEFEKTQQSSEVVSVTIRHDNVGEGDELIILEMDTSGPNVINVGSVNSSTEITITEDDFIYVAFTQERYTVGEGGSGEVCVEIVQDNGVLLPPGGTAVVLVSTMSTAGVQPETDYVPALSPASGALDENIRTTCFNFTSLEDDLVEGTENVSVIFSFTNRFGSFFPQRDTAIVFIADNDDFEVGFEFASYTVGEEEGIVNDTVYIVKMRDNTLLQGYTLSISVDDTKGPYPAKRDEDFSAPVLSVRFEVNDTRKPVPFSLLDDELEEGFEDFTLQLSDPRGEETVAIVVESAVVSIKDDDVVVIGFEMSVYVVFEGQTTEICVSIRDRTLSNDDHRNFTIRTTQLTQDPAESNRDFMVILGQTTFIARDPNVTRRCFDLETVDDSQMEPPERLNMSGVPISHFIEFNPNSATVWIVDDDSLLLPVPDISLLNCISQTEEVTRLKVTCTPPDEAAKVVELVCSVDGEPLKPCSQLSNRRKKRAAEPQVVTLDLLDYQDGVHVLEIVGLTQVTEILRGTVQFHGLAQPFSLDCVDEVTETGLYDVTCTTQRVLESLTCTVDGGTPKICSLKFVLDPSDYEEGQHMMVVKAVNLLGEIKYYNFTFVSAEPQAVSVWGDREFVAAVAIAGVAFIILLLLMLAICLLIFYHRKVNRLNKYGLDLRSENEYVGIDRNLSYRDHDEHVELVDYSRRPPDFQAPQRHPASRTSSSAAARSVSRDPSQRERPVSEASTVFVDAPTATTFHVPPPPGPTLKPTEASVTPVTIVHHHQQQREEPDHVTSPSQDDFADVQQAEEELLLAASGGVGSGNDSRGLKISRRHSVEVEKKPKSRKKVEDETSRTASFSGSRVRRTDSGGGAYSVPQGKELQTKEWEAALQREFDEELAKEKESVRARERRRETEQRERRKAREQVTRQQRAEARKEREKERDAAKERRLVQEARSPPTTTGGETSPTSPGPESPGPESFL